MILPAPRTCILLLTSLAAGTIDGEIVFPDTISSTADQAAGTLRTNAIDGSGLSEPLTEANYATLPHANGYAAPIQWLSNAIDAQTVTFGFNSPAPRIDQILLWNYTQIGRQDRTNESVSKVEVDTGAGFVDLGMEFILAGWDGASELTADVLEIGPQTNVSAIRITLEQDDGTNGEFAGGLNEVAFRGGPITEIDPRLVLPRQINWPGPATSLPFEVINAGDSLDLTISEVRVVGAHAGAFSLSGQLLPLVIPPGESAMVQLQVDPAWFPSLPVTLDARLEIDSDTPFQPTSYASVSGLLCDALPPAPLRVEAMPYLPSGVAPGQAAAVIDSSSATLANQVVSATWQLTGGGWNFQSLDNLVGSAQLVAGPGGELFELELSGGTVLPASGMTLVSGPTVTGLVGDPAAPRYSGRLPGRMLSCEFEAAAHNIGVTWAVELRDGAHYVRPSMTIRPLIAAPVTVDRVRLLDLVLSSGGAGLGVVGSVDGSPVVSDEFFLGMEHPSAIHGLAGSGPVTLVAEVTGSVTTEAGAAVTYSSALGAVVPGQLRRSFHSYVERERARPYHGYLHYNSWYDVSWNTGSGSIMTTENTLASMQGHIDNLIVPYAEPYDAFVFDDGWDDWNSLWDFNTATFPDQFVPHAGLAGCVGTDLGAWLSPFGGYGAAKDTRIAYGTSQGYETNLSGFSLSGPNYYAAFRNRCLQMVDDYRFSYFKFDGIGAGNGASGAGAEFIEDIEAMRTLIAELRAHEPGLFFNLTVGSWPSPFWTWSADSIWRAGEDTGFAGSGNAHEQWITYRDDECYHNIVVRAPLYPINSLMYGGIAWANNGNPSNPGFNSASFKSDVRAYFGSGTNLQELYISPARLGAPDWKNLAECAKWSRENAATLSDVRWIGGDPSAGQIYGWAAWRPGKGILTLRNPGGSTHQWSGTLEDAFELPASARGHYHLRSPWRENAGDTVVVQDAQSTLNISLAPYEVITLEATSTAPEVWLANPAYREWSLQRPSGRATPETAFGATGIANLLAFALGIDPLDLDVNASGRYSLAAGGSGPIFHYNRAADLGTASLVAEVSEDLDVWNSGPGHIVVVSEDAQPDGTVLVTVQADSSYSASPALFYRLRASHSP